MTAFVLKVIAYIFMILDHCAVVFEWDSALRCITRVSFPIFAYLISQGCKYTKNIKRYILRILICACISQIILFFMDIENHFVRANVLFNFFISCGGIYIFEKLKKYPYMNIMKYGVFLISMALVEIFKFDYGYLGAGLVFMFYLSESKKGQIISVFIFAFAKYGIYICKFFELLFEIGINALDNISVFTRFLFACFTMVTSIFIYFYNGKRGPSVKYLFYFLYPFHLFVILLIALLLS